MSFVCEKHTFFSALDIQGFLKIFGFYLTQADDLGRVVIPKEIRRTMRIREGDPTLTTLTPVARFVHALMDLSKRIGLE